MQLSRVPTFLSQHVMWIGLDDLAHPLKPCPESADPSFAEAGYNGMHLHNSSLLYTHLQHTAQPASTRAVYDSMAGHIRSHSSTFGSSSGSGSSGTGDAEGATGAVAMRRWLGLEGIDTLALWALFAAFLLCTLQVGVGPMGGTCLGMSSG